MGSYSGTGDDQVQLYRCGNSRFPGCGKILTEGQKEQEGKCPKCGSVGSTSYYPKTKWQLFKAYLLLLKTGELVEWRSENQQQTSSNQEKNL